MEHFKPPGALVFDGDLTQAWKEFKQLFEIYLTAVEADGKPDKTKIAMLLSAIGTEGVRRFNHMVWNAGEDKTKFTDVVKKLDAEFGGEERLVFNRFKFWEYKRGDHQKFDEFLTELRSLAVRGEFLERDNMLRDKIIFETKDKGLKERLLRTRDLDLQKTVDMCRAAETTQSEVSAMNAATHASSASKHVDAYERRGAAEKNRESKAHSQYKANFQSDSRGSYGEVCSRCGIAHGSEPKDCPAHGKQCFRCGALHHFGRRCGRGTRSRPPGRARDKSVREVTAGSHDVCSDDSDSQYFMDSLTKTLTVGSIAQEERARFEPVPVASSRIKS